MKFFKFCLFLFVALATAPLHADGLFFKDTPVQGGLHVFDMSKIFAEIYEKLDDVKWAGKNINVAIESLEKLNPNAHIAVTDERAVLVWKDKIIANYPRPAAGDWNGFGEITTALIMHLRENDSFLARASEGDIYQMVVECLMRGIDETGRYIGPTEDLIANGGQILTHTGLTGSRDTRGNFRVETVFQGSPGDLAGISAGDLIVAVDGRPARDLSDTDFAQMLSGFNSGTAKIKVATATGEKNLVLRRASIVIADADVIYRDAGNAGAILDIVVNQVSEGAVSIVAEALKKYPDIVGIILDLRTATGTDERAAARFAGLFIGQRAIMRVAQTPVDELEIVSTNDAITNAPVVVLMSNMTRGAAEGLVAAFYDARRGVLVGTPTAGQPRIATRISLSNGGVLELMNMAIKTSRGRTIDGRGMYPVVCLSNIRSAQQENAFFLNVVNDDFNYQDLNVDDTHTVEELRAGCPIIVSGTDEDALSRAVAVRILTGKVVYGQLISK